MFIINIHSKGSFPSCELSNFAPHPFHMDGVEIYSMEGFLQSLKFPDKEEQRKICMLSGRDAKTKGLHQKWKDDLFWNGSRYKRKSYEYRVLIERAYRNMLSNEDFRRALKVTRYKLLVHTIGKINRSKTVLTSWEFCILLMKLRKELFH